MKNTDMQKIMFNDRYGLTQAVLEGRKTVTRRELRGAPLLPTDAIEDVGLIGDEIQVIANGGESLISCRTRYKLCETVAVAQSYKDAGYAPTDLTDIIRNGDTVFIPFKEHKGWVNKMFVRWDYMLYRIRITSIRIERLQDISDEGCLREGVRYIPEIDRYYFERTDREEGFYFTSPRAAFAELIDRVSGRGTWDRNPYVVAYEFELLR